MESGDKVRTHQVGGLSLHLATPFEAKSEWVGNELAVRQLRAAWLSLGPNDPAMSPRLVGRPGVGKTTLAVHVAQTLGLPVYIMQGTSDTRPEDLLITPVIGEGRNIIYIASPLVTAMVTGGVCVLDEGNRMSEKSWASLASLLDHRRYVDSIIAGVRISAHASFRFVTTMNDDASVYDLPEYIHSRLNPQIFLDFADAETEGRIVKMAVPYVEGDLLAMLIGFLSAAHLAGERYSVRDGIQVARYAEKMRRVETGLNSSQALMHGIVSVLGQDALKYLPTDPRDPSHKRGLRFVKT